MRADVAAAQIVRASLATLRGRVDARAAEAVIQRAGVAVVGAGVDVVFIGAYATAARIVGAFVVVVAKRNLFTLTLPVALGNRTGVAVVKAAGIVAAGFIATGTVAAGLLGRTRRILANSPKAVVQRAGVTVIAVHGREYTAIGGVRIAGIGRARVAIKWFTHKHCIDNVSRLAIDPPHPPLAVERGECA